jgi:hypothetical protein
MWVLLISSLLMATAVMVVLVVVVVPLADLITLIGKLDSFIHNLLYFQLIAL